MKRYRKTWVFLLIVIVIIQFIQPKKNLSASSGEDDISRALIVPDGVHQTLMRKCYDCHSNHTNYPWYFNVQPIGWWLAAHVVEGKSELNFSEFGRYEADQARHKLEEMLEMVQDRSMPLKGYVWLHPESEITEDDQEAIDAWVKNLIGRD